MSTVYRPEAREGAGRILWGDAELIDRQADSIEVCAASVEEAVSYLREVAALYRKAASAATAGRTEL